MTHDEKLRLLLGSMAFVALILSGAVLGQVLHARSWPLRTVSGGGILVLAYVLAGQAKAYLLSIAFDLFAWGGLAAYTVLIFGLCWSMWHARRDG